MSLKKNRESLFSPCSQDVFLPLDCSHEETAVPPLWWMLPLKTPLLTSSFRHLNVPFIRFNQLPSLLCRHASRSGRRPRRALSVTSPAAPASRIPAGELEVADGAHGEALVCVCALGVESVADGAFAQFRFSPGASVCLRGGVLMVVTGVCSLCQG